MAMKKKEVDLSYGFDVESLLLYDCLGIWKKEKLVYICRYSLPRYGITGRDSMR